VGGHFGASTNRQLGQETACELGSEWPTLSELQSIETKILR